MEQEEADLIPKLVVLGALVVIAHFAIVIWHFVLLVRVRLSPPRIMLHYWR